MVFKFVRMLSKPYRTTEMIRQNYRALALTTALSYGAQTHRAGKLRGNQFEANALAQRGSSAC